MLRTTENLADCEQEIAHRHGNEAHESVRKRAGMAEKIENRSNEPIQITYNQYLDP